MSRKSELKSFASSFTYAARGIWYAIQNERNMRIHLVVTVYVLLFSLFFDLTSAQYAALLLTIGLVLCMELVNTAIEVCVNMNMPHFDPMARIAKDTAAGAVLMASLVAVAVAVVTFWDGPAFVRIFHFYLQHPLLFIGLVVSVAGALLFVLGGTKTANRKD